MNMKASVKYTTSEHVFLADFFSKTYKIQFLYTKSFSNNMKLKEDIMRYINTEKKKKKSYILESIHGSHHHTPWSIHFDSLILQLNPIRIKGRQFLTETQSVVYIPPDQATGYDSQPPHVYHRLTVDQENITVKENINQQIISF